MYVLSEGWHGTYEKILVKVLRTVVIGGRVLCLVDSGSPDRSEKYEILDYETSASCGRCASKTLTEDQIASLEESIAREGNDIYYRAKVLNGDNYNLGYEAPKQRCRSFRLQLFKDSLMQLQSTRVT